MTHELPKISGCFILWGVLPGERSSPLSGTAPCTQVGSRRGLQKGDLALQTALPGEPQSAKAEQVMAS